MEEKLHALVDDRAADETAEPSDEEQMLMTSPERDGDHDHEDCHRDRAADVAEQSCESDPRRRRVIVEAIVERNVELRDPRSIDHCVRQADKEPQGEQRCEQADDEMHGEKRVRRPSLSTSRPESAGRLGECARMTLMPVRRADGGGQHNREQEEANEGCRSVIFLQKLLRYVSLPSIVVVPTTCD